MTNGILDERPRKQLAIYLEQCKEVGADPEAIAKVAHSTIQYLRSSSAVRQQSQLNQDLEQRWFDSLDNGAPDFSVYADPMYLAELWACWIIYSRSYLRGICAAMACLDGCSILNHMGTVTGVVDLGCGCGYTTAALAQLFPGAVVTGTNIGSAPQTKIAHMMADKHDFDILTDVEDTGQRDLVFASEFFEHIQKPIDYLNYVLKTCQPRVLLCANTFTARGLGHFHEYIDETGEVRNGKTMSRRFNSHLRAAGYTKIKTEMWNGRPTYWSKS